MIPVERGNFDPRFLQLRVGALDSDSTENGEEPLVGRVRILTSTS